MAGDKQVRSESSAGGSKRKPRRRKSAGFLTALLQLISFSYFGRVFLVLLVTSILALLNILISRNQVDLFFQLCGIEMILAAAAFWLRLILRRES
jgi:hypothetical protein